MRLRGPAGRIVPPQSRKRRLFEFACDRVGGLWRWRELTLPLAALYLAYALAGKYAGSYVAALLAFAVSLVGLVSPSTLSRVPRRCTARSRWHRRRRRWARACVGLHWYRKLEHDALLIPELFSWHEDRERISVALRPLSEQA